MKNDQGKENSKRKGNLYDRIFKENAEHLFIPIIEEVLGLKIKSHVTLKEKFPKTLEREVDFLYEIYLENGEEWILHIEFQSQIDKSMIYRMGVYHGLILERHKKPIKHIVIYLGTRKNNMRTVMKQEEIFNSFDVINLHELDPYELLRSQVPEVVMLALLSNYDMERSERILRLIIERIQKLNPQQNSKKYLEQLIILSRLRNLENQTVKIIEDMPVIYDIKTDGLYKKGLKQGIEEIVIRCLANKISYEQIQLFTRLSLKEIKEIERKHKKEIERKYKN